MVELIQVMEVVTVVFTLGMFFTGIPPCVDMVKTGETKNVPFPFFLLSAVSCSGMFHYGLLINNRALIFINAVGLFLQIIYTLAFLVTVKSKSKYVLYTSVGLAYVSGLYWYLITSVPSDSGWADILGSSASKITTVMCTLPIIEIIQNVRNKNADGMPVIMLLGGLACGTSWLIFGLMINDYNVYMPNIPGILITLAKLYVIQLYSPATEKVKSA